MLTILVAVLLQAQAPPMDDYRGIWRAALEEISDSRPGRTIVLLDTTAGTCGTPVVHPCFTLRDPLIAARQIPAADLQRLAALLEQRPVAIDDLHMPQVRPISRADFDALAKAGHGEDFWAAFYKRHPGSAGWVVLSAPAIAGSGDTAWLLMDHLYGSLGAEGWLLSLRRDRDGWQVARKWLLWQS